jgi:cytochrome c-type biogenesis protein CcmF
MLTEIGHYALVLSLALAVIQTLVPLIGAQRRDARMMAAGTSATLAVAASIALAFGLLTFAYLRSDFSVANVFENSHSLKPALYKISGVWGNHEGSMLLWVLILALFGAAVALFGRNLPATLKANVLAVQGSVAVAFLLFILLTSNPFLRLDPPPFEGRDLNPVLQDPGLAIHPPLLYLGYVGFSVAFAFAVAALIEGKVDAAWARWVRPWTLAAWLFLTLGIAMGSYWAYYELGWGGWWFWDPVENASFMPWLAGTALLHSAVVMEKRDTLKSWTVLLAILAFSLSLLGTFLVRSGVLTSVHAFATDPKRGIFILAILAVFIGGSLSLYAWRAPTFRAGGLFAPVSREGALLINNLFLVAACFAVLLGTLFPLIVEVLTGRKSELSVGAPYFNLVVGSLLLILMLIVPVGPFLAWKRGDLVSVGERLVVAAGAGAVAAAIAWYATRGGPVLAPFGVGIAAWLMVGALADLASRAGFRRGGVKPSVGVRRLFGLPGAAWGAAFAHFGLGVTLLGIVAETNWSSEKILVMKPAETVAIAGYDVAFDSLSRERGPNFTADVGRFTVRHAGIVVANMEPSKRVFSARQMPTTEAALASFGPSQLYISLGDVQPGGAVAVRIYYKPLVLLIWLGAVAMAIGGAFSLADRRLRVGAPKPAAIRPRPTGAQPAE